MKESGGGCRKKAWCFMLAAGALFSLGCVFSLGWKLWDAWQDHRHRDMEKKRFERVVPPMEHANPLSRGELDAMVSGNWSLDHALDVLGEPSQRRITAREVTLFYELANDKSQVGGSDLFFSFALSFANGILRNWWPIGKGDSPRNSGRPGGTAGTPEAAAGAKHVPLDIAGCDSFAQIVDKLQSGQAHARATIDGEEVLLVTGHTFDIAGRRASIAADIYHCADGVPAYMGSVMSGGTACPLAIANGKLYACGNHCAHKYTVGNGSLMLDQAASVQYHAKGDPEYFVRSEVRDLATGPDGRVEDDSWLSTLYDEYSQGQTVEFHPVP